MLQLKWIVSEKTDREIGFKSTTAAAVKTLIRRVGDWWLKIVGVFHGHPVGEGASRSSHHFGWVRVVAGAGLGWIGPGFIIEIFAVEQGKFTGAIFILRASPILNSLRLAWDGIVEVLY